MLGTSQAIWAADIRAPSTEQREPFLMSLRRLGRPLVELAPSLAPSNSAVVGTYRALGHSRRCARLPR